MDWNQLKFKFKAFIRQSPVVLRDSLIFIVTAFIGVIFNIVIGYGFIKNSILDIQLFDFVMSNEVLYGLLSTCTGIIMSILYFYLNAKKKRRNLNVVLIITLPLSVFLSVITLIQTRIPKIFAASIFDICLWINIIGFAILVVFYNYDSEVAEREEKVQMTADNYKEITEGEINNQKIKL